MAIKSKSRYDTQIRQFVDDNQDLFPLHRGETPHIEYIKGSFFDYEWTQASVVFSNSTCFSDEIFYKIYEKIQEMPSGSFHINICNWMPEEFMSNWDCVNPFMRVMSWGTGEILIYRKK